MPISRRTFLKTSTALAGAFWVRPARSLAIASTLPPVLPPVLPPRQTHDYYPDPDQLLRTDWERYDLLLIPAYATAELIARNAVETLPGPPGRAHDPDGAFTIPGEFTLTALAYADAPPDGAAW